MNTERSADEAAVRALYQQLIDGWNEGSGEAFALPFAEDGDLVAFDGTHFKGRSEIVPFHQQLFQTYLKGTRLVGNVKDVRVLNNDVALIHAVGGTAMREKSIRSPEWEFSPDSRGGPNQWLLAAGRPSEHADPPDGSEHGRYLCLALVGLDVETPTAKVLSVGSSPLRPNKAINPTAGEACSHCGPALRSPAAGYGQRWAA